jgi:hypothetical protein
VDVTLSGESDLKQFMQVASLQAYTIQLRGYFDIPRMTTEKPVLAIDIDEVLAQFLSKLTHYHNTHYGKQRLSINDHFISYFLLFV